MGRSSASKGLGGFKASIALLAGVTCGAGLAPRSALANSGNDYGDPAAAQQMRLFNNGDLSDSYIAGYLSALRTQLEAHDAQVIGKLAQGDCQPMVRAEFLKGGQMGAPERNKGFESGIIHVEAISCPPQGTAERALSIMLDPRFRLDTLPGELEESRIEDGYLCEKTRAVTAVLNETGYCMKVAPFSRASLAKSAWLSLHSNRASQPVYLNETVLSFVDTPNGPRGHLEGYLRLQNIFSILHHEVLVKIQSEQSNALDTLAERLKP